MTVIGLRLYTASGGSISARITEEEATRIKNVLTLYADGKLPEDARLTVTGNGAGCGIQLSDFSAAAFRPNVPAPRYEKYLTFHLVIEGGSHINGIVNEEGRAAFMAEIGKSSGISMIHSGGHEIWVMPEDLKAWKTVDGYPTDNEDEDMGFERNAPPRRQNYGNRGNGGYHGNGYRGDSVHRNGGWNPPRGQNLNYR